MSEQTQPKIRPGRYRGRATEAALANTSTGKKQLGILFELLDEGWEGTLITWYGFFGDEPDRGGKTATERTVDVLDLCGWQGDDLSDFSGLDTNEVELIVEIG